MEDPTLDGDPRAYALGNFKWQVRGAYDSSGLKASGNANRLGQCGLDLESIALSSFQVQKMFSGWATNATQAIVNAVDNNDFNLTLANRTLHLAILMPCGWKIFQSRQTLTKSR